MKHILAPLTVIATAAFVISPLVTEPFSGFDPSRFPVPQIDPPVQPAGYAFAIWGLIYLWLMLSAAYGIWARRKDAGWNRMRLPLVLSLGPGALWLWVAGINPIVATALIFWMMATAIWALINAPRHDRWLAQAPVALYAGWLTAAAHVSLGILLGGYGLAAPPIAALIALSSAVVVAAGVLSAKRCAPEYAATLVWALVGVLIANLGGSATVQGAALLGIVIMTGMAIWGFKTGQPRPA